jgi:hypothetical protein
MTHATDSGPTCTHCGCTIYTYDVHSESLGERTRIYAGFRCVDCKRVGQFQLRAEPATVVDVRSAHERFAADPSYWGAY